jgi:hypothetical protein
MLSDRELSLRDLIMDVRSDVYGTGETCADRDESKGTSDDDELSLRELAQALGEEPPRASAPKPPGATAQPLKHTAAPQQDDTPPGAPSPCAATQPLKRAARPRQEATPPAAPKPPAAEAPPPIPAAPPQAPEKAGRQFACPGCGSLARWLPDLAGKRMRCPRCRTVFRSPSA